ncbi:MAG: DNA polymerase ligase N-terminal domain-containing protein [Pirellulales bacterium]
MSLKTYYKKRDFDRSPEPSGGDKPGPAGGHQFVIQKHDASRLHYDFRLEMDDVLKSWAVPKGPSLDPHERSLAVQVEDHPLEYAGFEGVIPKGQYGGGTVMVWDRGTWTPEGDPQQGLKKGKLKFQLDGDKLHGKWTLVRMSGKAGDDGKNWLLIKGKDDAARSDDGYSFLKESNLSVLSDRTLGEIASEKDRVWHSNGAGETSAEKESSKAVSVDASDLKGLQDVRCRKRSNHNWRPWSPNRRKVTVGFMN